MQEMEIEWGRESAQDRYGEEGRGFRIRSGSYESNSSVSTQDEYFSNIMAGEPLSASVIRCVCVAESSLY